MNTCSLIIKKIQKHTQLPLQSIFLGLLVDVCTTWFKSPHVNISLEHHNRDTFSECIDISRTIGWFTSYFPMHFNCSHITNIFELILMVNQRVLDVPNHGVGFSLLKYNQKINHINYSMPEVGFNFHGQYHENQNDFFSVCHDFQGSNIAPNNKRPHLLDIVIKQVDDQFSISWQYSRNKHKDVTIKQLATLFKEALHRLSEANFKNDIRIMPPSRLIQKLTNVESNYPLCMIHPINGDNTSYTHLARHLVTPIPIYAIGSYLFENNSKQFLSIHQIASFYVEELLQRQESSTYHLAGWSFGAIIAFEMAKILEKMNKKVKSVSLFDQTYNIQSLMVGSNDIIELIGMKYYFIQHQLNLPDAKLKDLEGLIVEEQLSLLLDKITKVNVDQIEQHPDLSQLIRIHFFHFNALLTHSIEDEINADVLLFVSDSSRKDKHADFQSWKQHFTGSSFYHELAGNHLNLFMSSNLSVIAKKLDNYFKSSNGSFR